jgi:hypothetical protein
MCKAVEIGKKGEDALRYHRGIKNLIKKSCRFLKSLKGGNTFAHIISYLQKKIHQT